MHPKSFVAFFLCILAAVTTSAQRVTYGYLDPADSTANMYIAVLPEKKPVNACMFLMDGFGASPKSVLTETDLPFLAAKQGILTIIPLLRTGSLYFGSDDASQQSLREMINYVVTKYHLQKKDFFIGGFSIGGTCAIKYAELAAQSDTMVKVKAVFGIDPPLDWERFYHAAKRVVRLSANTGVSDEVTYIVNRIEQEMGGTPQTSLPNYYRLSPYSFSDTTQQAVKSLLNVPVMIVSEPDMDWWMSQRGYDYNYINATDHAAMINELQRLGNRQAVLVTTHNKGFRKPGNVRHPHSYSILDNAALLRWLRGL